ncbi:MAG: ABC transporter permease [Planctomycetota bacterium]|jgi:peptide/nickel transport system permease protein
MGYNREQNAEMIQEAVKGRSLWSDAIRRLRKRTFAMVCFGIVLVYFILAGMIYLDDLFGWNLKAFQWNQIVGPSYRAPLEVFEWTPEEQTASKTGKTLFGTDFLGQSTLRKTIYGAKTSITVALCASLISLLIGVPLGAIAGYFRGWVDDVIVWFYTTLGTIPYILLVMAFAVVLRDRNIFGWEIRGITAVYLAIGLTSWVGICRLIRGEIIKRKESEYVLAARALGCSNGRIIFKHLLPNVFHVIIINFSLRFVSFIHAEVILSFLGLGETDKPSWGGMIDAARTELARNVWWEMAAATIAIFFISLALNIFGDALRDCLDPKLRTD